MFFSTFFRRFLDQACTFENSLYPGDYENLDAGFRCVFFLRFSEFVSALNVGTPLSESVVNGAVSSG